MEELVKKMHTRWLAMKERILRECDERSLRYLAEEYRNCKLFNGTEDLKELVGLMTSPQGSEVCLTYQFPDIADLRQVKAFSPERYGLYIDAGEITLRNPEKVVFAGRTSATVIYDGLERYEAFLMHGATAAINASGWAVVKVHSSQGCEVTSNVTDHALML